jgi:hypothetical protein
MSKAPEIIKAAPNKYVTLEEGTDFRRIAEIMSAAGYQMNHATARNVLMNSLGRLVRNVSEELGATITEEQTKKILKDQQVHEALSDVLFEAYSQIEKEKTKT